MALNLRAQGLGYDAIAEALYEKGITGENGGTVAVSTISKDIRACMEQLAEETSSSAEEFRGLELRRLDMALSALAKKVRRGDVPAIAAWHKNIEIRAKLLGLNAPVQVQVQQTVKHEIEVFVQFLQGRLSEETFAEVMDAIGELGSDRGIDMSEPLPQLPSIEDIDAIAVDEDEDEGAIAVDGDEDGAIAVDEMSEIGDPEITDETEE